MLSIPVWMVSTVVPTLSSVGWVTEVAEKADRLFAYYMTSEYSQSNAYYKEITSLTWHIQQFGSDPSVLKKRIEDDLMTYLSRYFEMVDLEVSTQHPNPEDPEKINIRISAIVYDQGKRYSLGREIQATKSKVVKIINLNQGVE